MVHEAVLAESPVFGAMTGLPFKEKQERTIRLPDDKASHIRCVVAFLYTGGFRTQSECDLRTQEVGNQEEGPPTKFRRLGSTVNHPSGDRVPTDLKTSGSSVITQPETEPLTNSERAMAEDLAQIFMLGDKYQLSDLRRCALQKLVWRFTPSRFPIRFLHLVTILNLHIPESDLRFRKFVQTYLRHGAFRARENAEETVGLIIDNGYMRQSGVLAEEILSAYVYDSPRHEADSDSDGLPALSSIPSL